MARLVVNPHGTAQHDGGSRNRGESFAKIRPEDGERHPPLPQQVAEHAGRNFGVVLNDLDL